MTDLSNTSMYMGETTCVEVDRDHGVIRVFSAKTGRMFQRFQVPTGADKGKDDDGVSEDRERKHP